MTARKEERLGSLCAPDRRPVNWQQAEYYQPEQLLQEMERVFDICHGCRRCVNLCDAFPTLFDLIDQTESGELDAVNPEEFPKVVEQCYLCDRCYMTKCPYVPPHPWQVDFPHVMLQAKAIAHQQGKTRWPHKLLTNTNLIGSFATLPLLYGLINWANQQSWARHLLTTLLNIHPDAILPTFMRRRRHQPKQLSQPHAKVVLFTTCYGQYNDPQLVDDLIAILEHNKIQIRLINNEKCCGMPKFELGDFKSITRLKNNNIPQLTQQIDAGWDIIGLIPSCVLMFKQELPLLFSDDPEVKKVRNAFYDPFEYLMMQHKAGLFNTHFPNTLGTINYHVACHLQVQNIGLNTQKILRLIPDTQIKSIQRCSGHDGTYGVRTKTHETAVKICRPIIKQIKQQPANYYSSDCPLAAQHISHGLADSTQATHPLRLLRQAYGI